MPGCPPAASRCDRRVDIAEYVCDGERVLLALRCLGFVRRERGYVDQSRDAVISARIGDQGAAVGVADEQNRAAGLAHRAIHRREVTRERSHDDAFTLKRPLAPGIARSCDCYVALQMIAVIRQSARAATVPASGRGIW